MKLVIKRFGQLTAKELYQILSLRAETFIVDQQIMYNDLDNVDQVSTHVFYQDTDSVAGMTPIEERVTKPREVTGHTRLKKPMTGILLNFSTAG